MIAFRLVLFPSYNVKEKGSMDREQPAPSAQAASAQKTEEGKLDYDRFYLICQYGDAEQLEVLATMQLLTSRSP